MQNIIDEVGFDGTYSDFLEFLATDKQFYATDAQDLLEKRLSESRRVLYATC